MKCRICAIVLSPWGRTAGIPLLRCRGCGSIHADCPKPSEDLYADLYNRPDEVPPLVAASLDRVVSSMSSFRTHGRWLDIGFGQGALLDSAARAGWQCHGTEHSEVAVEKARARGFVTAPETGAFADRFFDVVSLIEVVEHVEDPRWFLTEARRVLRPGGCLYVTTPNAWSVNRWTLGASWSIFCPPDHLTIFSPRGLRELLWQCGFRRNAVCTEGLNPFEILNRAQKREGKDFHRVNAGLELCTSLSASPGRRRLKTLANIILSGTRLGDSLKVRSV